MHRTIRRASLVVASASLMYGIALQAQTTHQKPAQKQVKKSNKPTLVVFLTVDQMRSDYLARFNSQLTGGLARLYRGGAFMVNGYQDHAITETAPGHSTTMSGRFPVHNGITMNSLGVGDTTVKLVDAKGGGASPFRFRGTTLTDWMRTADPATKVLSISRKDRAAILPIGKSKSPVFWYAPSSGIFTTSTYYADTLPTWLVQFNAKKLPESYVGKDWTLLRPERDYPEPDSVPAETGGKDFTFPHRAPTDPQKIAKDLPEFPWMDQLTLEAALAGVRAMKLGTGPHTDLLAVSLSTTDAIGHQYGPDSREIHDQILRLDRFLGAFLDTLFSMRDSTRILITLTADHGVGPIPGIASRVEPNTGAIFVDLIPLIRQFRGSLTNQGISARAFNFQEGVLKLDRPALESMHINPDSLVTAFRDSVLKVPGILRADRISELQKMDTVHDAIARRWLHMFGSNDGVDLVVTMKPHNYWQFHVDGGQHGTPHDYDAHVPILFYGWNVKPGKYTDFSRVVDMAPTIAAMLGVPQSEPTDGHPLKEIIRQ